MPTYEYACTACGEHFEVIQRFADAPLEVCEVCGGALKRVFHPVGIVLKGSGFYATDNRAKKKFLPAKDKESGGGESSSSGDSGSSESSGSGSGSDKPSGGSSGGGGSSKTSTDSSGGSTPAKSSSPEKKA